MTLDVDEGSVFFENCSRCTMAVYSGGNRLHRDLDRIRAVGKGRLARAARALWFCYFRVRIGHLTPPPWSRSLSYLFSITSVATEGLNVFFRPMLLKKSVLQWL